ncbi:hypothetical protein [Microbacterium sp. 8M]|uniref:hypothetical protein n=1 Tax=Microbacterium sp. 8M TaxID=2653153 RepID=UPI001357EDB9|nr:hypothetical protein [Microbacterium sp. 8M]
MALLTFERAADRTGIALATMKAMRSSSISDARKIMMLSGETEELRELVIDLDEAVASLTDVRSRFMELERALMQARKNPPQPGEAEAGS